MVKVVSQDDVALRINHKIVGRVEACLAQWDVVDKTTGGGQTKIAGGAGARKCSHTAIHEDYAKSMLVDG